MSLRYDWLNKIFINLAFFLFIFSAVFIFLCNPSAKRQVPGAKPLNSNIVVNVQIDEKFLDDFSIFMDDKKVPPGKIYKNNSYVFYALENSPVHKLYFKAAKDALNSISNITISLGRNIYYYEKEDIAKFKKTSNDIYFFPENIRYDKNAKYITDLGIRHKFTTGFLSVFYHLESYIMPVLLLAFGFLIYNANKEKFAFSFNIFKTGAIWIILILGLLFRTDLMNEPFWCDELYTATIASNPDMPFMTTFKDPGNPPLFFILARFWMMLFGNSETVCRILPLIFSIFSIFLIYVFVKENYNKGCGLLASFLFTINIYSIASAKEFRGYSLAIFLIMLSSIYLFKIIKDSGSKTKDFVLYGLIAALMANGHYFLIFILISNFIFGFCFLKGKSRLKFFCANLFAAFAFLPHFLYTGLNNGLLDETFNYVIQNIGAKRMFVWVCSQFFNPVIVIICSIIFIILFVKKREFLKKEDDYRFLFIYSFFTIFMLFFLSMDFGLLIKPIARPYYYLIISEFISIIMALALYLPIKNKKARIVYATFVSMFTVFNFSFLFNYIDKSPIAIYKLNGVINFYYLDSKHLLKEGKTTAIIVFDKKDYAKYYKDKISPNTKIEDYIIDDRYEFYNKIKNMDADSMYSIIHAMRLQEFIKELEPYFNLSFILQDDNAIIVKITKR